MEYMCFSPCNNNHFIFHFALPIFRSLLTHNKCTLQPMYSTANVFYGQCILRPMYCTANVFYIRHILCSIYCTSRSIPHTCCAPFMVSLVCRLGMYCSLFSCSLDLEYLLRPTSVRDTFANCAITVGSSAVPDSSSRGTDSSLPLRCGPCCAA